MFIKLKRVIRPQKYLTFIGEGKDFYLGLKIDKELGNTLIKIGFSKNLTVGETLLPAVVGKATEFNAEGKEKIRKDLPKETVYYPREWTVTDWGGYEHSGVSYMPYERYPRELIPPPSVELRIIENKGDKFVVSPKLTNISSKHDEIKHIMNMFSEVFKGIEILKEDLSAPFKAKVIRLNWELLPPGVNPWERVKTQIRDIVQKNSSSEKIMMTERLKHIEKYNPNQVAVGLGGFTGYVAFGFKDKKFYLLESIHYGNATYVLGDDWQRLSQLTKAEILHNNFQEDRIIHNDGWFNGVDALMSK